MGDGASDGWDVLAALPVAVVVTGGGAVRWANDRAASCLGRGPGGLAGRPVADVEELAADTGFALDWAQLPGGGRAGVLRRSEHPLAATLLDRAGEALGASLNVDRVLVRLVHLALGGLADACAVGLVDGAVLRRVAGARTGAGVEVRSASIRLDAHAAAAGRRLSSAHPELHEDLDPPALGDLLPAGPEWALLHAEPPSSAVVVPLRARGATSGAAVLLATGGRRFGAGDLALATELAHRAAVAVDNARLYRDRSEVAAVLQQSLLPPGLPDAPGLSFGAAYRPAGDGATPGGDFYDAFPVDGERWAVVVGDVCGKGVRAATLSGLARHTIRAAAPVTSGPGAVLSALNDAVLRAGAPSEVLFCTAVVAELVPSTAGGGARVRVAVGGHPRPFVVRRGGAVDEVDARGPLLGAFAAAVTGERDADLGPGDALVLYTDGLVEARAGQEQFGTARLRRVLGDCASQPPAMVAERLVAEVESFVGGRPADDLAVLVVAADG